MAIGLATVVLAGEGPARTRQAADRQAGWRSPLRQQIKGNRSVYAIEKFPALPHNDWRGNETQLIDEAHGKQRTPQSSTTMNLHFAIGLCFHRRELGTDILVENGNGFPRGVDRLRRGHEFWQRIEFGRVPVRRVFDSRPNGGKRLVGTASEQKACRAGGPFRSYLFKRLVDKRHQPTAAFEPIRTIFIGRPRSLVNAIH